MVLEFVGLEFRVLCFVFCFMFQVSCFGFRVSRPGFRVSCFRFRVSGFRFRFPGSEFRGTDDVHARAVEPARADGRVHPLFVGTRKRATTPKLVCIFSQLRPFEGIPGENAPS